MTTSRSLIDGIRLAMLVIASSLVFTVTMLVNGRLFAADAAPYVVSVWPAPGTQDVPMNAAVDGSLSVQFSEPVGLAIGAVELTCERSGQHTLSVSETLPTFSIVSDRLFLPGESCVATVEGELVHDLDEDDPPDLMNSSAIWSFRTEGEWIVINELDAMSLDASGEFLELYDGGRGNVALDGLSFVIFGEDGALAYVAESLSGYQTRPDGLFLIGDSGVGGTDFQLSNGFFLDAAGGVAIYQALPAGFLGSPPPPDLEPIDAVVYGGAGAELMALLLPGEIPLDEGSQGTATQVSNQRCPDGGGLPRTTASFLQELPTPGVNNDCPIDDPPEVSAVSPMPGATDVPLSAIIEIEFSEPVVVDEDAIELICTESGVHAYTISEDGDSYQFLPAIPFGENEQCQVTLYAEKVSDVDLIDPPDHLATDVIWNFTVEDLTADYVMINELDADTPGTDSAEFIELYDGGVGNTNLDGLIVVFWNGANDTSYRTIDLNGFDTDSEGYFLLGNSEVAGADIVFPDGTLQNGPDAVGIYAAHQAEFPSGTPLKFEGLIDAIVYGPAAQIDEELLALLEPDQPQVDEAARGNGPGHSLQRCPNGEGGMRRTETYRPDIPTPGGPSQCSYDEPPEIIAHSPAVGAVDILPNSNLVVEFSENVVVDDGWLAIGCRSSGTHSSVVTGGPKSFTITPLVPFSAGEECEVMLIAEKIHDSDLDDPPDNPLEDHVWQFQVMALPSIQFVTSGSFLIGDETQFYGEVEGTGPFNVSWNFGDGSMPAAGLAVTHEFPTIGIFNVTLKVSNPAGTVTLRKAIVIQQRTFYFPMASNN